MSSPNLEADPREPRGLMILWWVSAGLGFVGLVHLPGTSVGLPSSWPLGLRLAVVLPPLAVLQFGPFLASFSAHVRRLRGDHSLAARLLPLVPAITVIGMVIGTGRGRWFEAACVIVLSVLAWGGLSAQLDARRRDQERTETRPAVLTEQSGPAGN